ncbi:C1 family peptidase [Psychroserpens sp. SPM9]|uniref:C1 family peptidase n=1 Tax=Psychroserpens sp. SPM9 TaxID=2975598 RepID=UPI0021A5A971|nr:C1 family peptidase [Psychroserpens sp. SPM9]MDG5491846.1 C1 family peptidase [Psychroserpens sp. SPM9]
MKNNSILILLALTSFFSFSQTYEFETTIDLEATDVISQGSTGTCWSFSTSSFLESEITRLTGKYIDLSEMYTVRHTYSNKAWNYVMRQGKAQFSQGGLAHDVMNSISKYGVVPNEVYSGLSEGETRHNHSQLADSLKTILNTYLDNTKAYTSNWKTDVEQTLDHYLGKDITTFTFDGKQYTPQSFLEMTTINPDDYVTITSFTHQPYYSNFILNIPDNFSNGGFYNVTLDDLVSITNHALTNGFSIELDCDVSETTFSPQHGLAIIPEEDGKNALINVGKEKTITADYRQQEFENFNTTDDHLMHITGMLKDQNGTIYYKVKNSWGKQGLGNDGYIYMSEAYFKLKTISIMIHKDALPDAIKSKLELH